MCLVLDTCCLPDVFNPKSHNHVNFKPVLDWITNGSGKVVYGGTKYKRELKACAKYLQLLIELQRQGKVVLVPDELVNLREEDVLELETDPDFDDAHIIAIIIVSKCKIVCTNDKRSHRFIKKKELYPKDVSRPKIYSKSLHRTQLTNNNIAEVCKRC